MLIKIKPDKWQSTMKVNIPSKPEILQNYVQEGVLSGVQTGASVGYKAGGIWGGIIGAVGGGLVGFGSGKTNQYAAETQHHKDFLQGGQDRVLAYQQAQASQDKSYNNPTFSHMSGASTLPVADPTQLSRPVEPSQPTQRQEQLRSLGLG